MVAGEVVAIGKIIIRKIVEFVLANPKIAAGLAIGAALAGLIATIPLLGTILAPIATPISIIYGGAVGAGMQDRVASTSPMSGAVALAIKFFELLASIFNGVREHWGA